MKNKTLLAALLLSALLSVFFFDVLFLGKTYQSADAQSARSLTMAAENDAMFPQHFPYIFSGMPAIFCYTSPYLYFPNILTTWMPTYKSLYIGHILHYLLAGMGMFLLLKRGYGFWAGIVGAISFMFTTNMLGQEIFGHGGLMMTASYIPMIFFVSRKCFNFTSSRDYRDWGILALLIGLQMQRAHYQIIYYTWMLIGIYFIYSNWHNLKFRWKWNLQKMVMLIGCGILAIGMAAMNLLPTIEYAEHSIRSSLSFDYASSWSFHPKEIITFILPHFYGFGDSTYTGFLQFTHFPNYLGFSVVILACFARGTMVKFLIAVILVSLLISFGKYTPLYEFMYNYLPFFDKFRAPMMILILVQFSVALLAGMGFHFLSNRAKQKGWSSLNPVFMVIPAILIDLFFVGYKINKTHEIVDLKKKDGIVEFFDKNPGQYRVAFLPPLSNTNKYAVHGIETVGGYHAAKLKIYDKFLQKPLSLQSLGILNTAFIVSKEKLDLDLPVAVMAQGVYIYVNTQALPRYFLTKKGGKIQVLDKQIEYAKLGVSLISPQRLIISEIYYPSWKIYVNGKKAENEIWRNLLCSVQLEAGEHLVELKYESTYFNIGALVCFLSMGIIGFLIIKRRK